MCSSKGNKLDASKAYKIITEQIVGEYTLINNRLGWYVTSQAFLLTAYGVWTGQQDSALNAIAKIWFPCLGVGASVMILIALAGATATIQTWWKLRETYINKNSLLGQLIYVKRSPLWHPAGLITPFFFPIGFLAFWVNLLRVSQGNLFVSITGWLNTVLVNLLVHHA